MDGTNIMGTFSMCNFIYLFFLKPRGVLYSGVFPKYSQWHIAVVVRINIILCMLYYIVWYPRGAFSKHRAVAVFH